jgi:hypothetical protein
MKTTKEIGNQLEDLIVSYIKRIEPNCRRTKNSGGSQELEDVLSKFFMVQCKVDNKGKNIIIKKTDWDKMINALPINSHRIPLFCHQHLSGLVTVTLTVEDYFKTVYRAVETSGDIQ